MLPIPKAIRISSAVCRARIASGITAREGRGIWRHPVQPLACYGNRRVHSDTNTESNHSDTKTTSRYHRQHEPSPGSSESDTFDKEFDSRIPSNNARSALSDAYQHSGVDNNHPKRPGRDSMSEEERRAQDQKEEEVREHNEDMEKRYDRAFNQMTQDGEQKTLDSEVDEQGTKK